MTSWMLNTAIPSLDGLNKQFYKELIDNDRRKKYYSASCSNVAREQIPTACKWHISDIYAGENDWQAACEEYKSKLPQLQAMQGQLNTAAAVCAALKLQEELAKLLDKIYAYARLQQDADNTDQKLQASQARLKVWRQPSVTLTLL